MTRSRSVVFLASVLLAAPAAAQEPADRAVPRFTITTVAGTGECGFTGDDGPAVEARIQRPTAVAVTSTGVLYIADEANQRVRMVEDGYISTFMGTLSSAPQAEERYAFETNLDNAYGIATDAEDNLYVLSRGHSKIFEVGEDGIARRIVGTGVAGFSGDGGPALEAQINFSNHLVADAAGNLYIADTGNNRVRRVSTDGIITTWAGTGARGYTGDGGPATEATFAGPAAIAIDGQGSVYVADFANHCIRMITSEGIITTIAGTGTSGYNGEGKPALESQIGEPCGVDVDREGFVYIGDQVNNRVRVVTPWGTMHTVAGTGVRGLTGDGGPAELAQTSNPDIIAVDREGNVFIPDHINCAVRKLTRIRDQRDPRNGGG
jgi:sugar lactone lactonase YvrE